MKIIIVKDQVEGGKVAFDLLKEALASGAKTLGLATGSSPLEFYKQIRASDLDFSNVTSINLMSTLDFHLIVSSPTIILWRSNFLIISHLKPPIFLMV